jgi:3-phenylpropionate/cinnamic acid dioxygenase small subunit
MKSDRLREIEQFLHQEARLLDERKFRDWLSLLAEDIKYWIPLRSSRFTRQSHAISTDRAEYQDRELTEPDEFAHMDDTKQTLTMRVARLETGTAWAEEPPSRTVHIITNIQAEPTDNPDETRVYSNFLLFRGRLETEEDVLVGHGYDLLRSTADGWGLDWRRVGGGRRGLGGRTGGGVWATGRARHLRRHHNIRPYSAYVSD